MAMPSPAIAHGDTAICPTGSFLAESRNVASRPGYGNDELALLTVDRRAIADGEEPGGQAGVQPSFETAAHGGLLRMRAFFAERS
jgi:hypothetical protein